MPRLNCLRVLAAIAVLFSVTACDTTSQSVAQTKPASAQKYYSEDTPQTGSHIARRYAVDDPNKPADATATYTPTVMQTQNIGGPPVGQRGN